jgi:membrane protease YdiL (CAAX protease family)
MTESVPTGTKHLRVTHGFAFLLVLVCTTSAPPVRDWPSPLFGGWLAPLAGYFAVVLCVPSLRRSLSWLHFGRITAATVSATLLVIVVTATVLLLVSQPQFPRGFGNFLPFVTLLGVFISGALFSIGNATIQEFVFRGILFDSLESISGRWGAVFLTSFIFGLGHYQVMPSGIIGASAAVDLGLALAILRVWSGGLALPILVHIASDAIIVYRAVHAAAN